MKTTENIFHRLIEERLQMLDTNQLKILYAIIVHCFAHHKSFISTQNFFNLWCELNALCHEIDESFPEPYDDYELIKDFCHAHPYYFIDILPFSLITKLFSEHFDQHLEILSNLIQIIYEQDIKAANQYTIDVFKLEHTAEELATDLEEHIKHYS